MNNSAPFRTIAVSILALLLVAGTLAAQSTGSTSGGNAAPAHKAFSVDNAELKRFAGALKDVHVIQIGFQESFQKAVTKSPLSQKEFFRLYQSERTTHALPSNASSTERKEYRTLLNAVLKMEQDARLQMVAVVKKDGFKVARFNEIVRAVHTDPALAKRLAKAQQ